MAFVLVGGDANECRAKDGVWQVKSDSGKANGKLGEANVKLDEAKRNLSVAEE